MVIADSGFPLELVNGEVLDSLLHAVSAHFVTTSPAEPRGVTFNSRQD